MRLPLLLAALVLCASGCDSAGTEPSVTPPPVIPPPVVLRSFDLAGVPAQTEIELTDADTIAVAGLFGPSRPAGVSVSITATGGATATGTAGALVVRAGALGDATVTLAASAPGYRDTTAMLAVRVVPGVCPPAAPSGARDYFPTADGQVWSFSVVESQSPTRTATMTFADVRCVRGSRTGTIRYRAGEGALFSTSFSESPTNVVRFSTPTFMQASPVYIVDRYAATGAAAVTVRCSGCSPIHNSADLVDGVGLTAEFLSVQFFSTDFRTRRLTRLP